MLKSIVTSLDQVPEHLRDDYTPTNDGRFELQVDGLDPLRNALTMERQHRKNAQNRARELEQQIRIARGPQSKPESEMTRREKFMAEAARRLAGLQGEAYAAEIAKLDAEMDTPIAADVEEHGAKLKAKYEQDEAFVHRLQREQEARSIVSQLAKPGCETILMPHVLERITVAPNGDAWQVTIKDKKGQPTSIDALRDELAADRAFAPIIRGASEEDEAEHARKVAEMLGEAPSSRAQRLTRADFDRLSPGAQAAAAKSGAKILDH